ncbi:unnamed protein product [Brachionus calyciflorus]|uniref:Uncharacterized protein n=1 Tax=Brachionus calyciflorus TaxID=104777 RepID=A0A814HNM8_9BILA|nr:unnamed protein product [Brachionus calyciflorus]
MRKILIINLKLIESIRIGIDDPIVQKMLNSSLVQTICVSGFCSCALVHYNQNYANSNSRSRQMFMMATVIGGFHGIFLSYKFKSINVLFIGSSTGAITFSTTKRYLERKQLVRK